MDNEPADTAEEKVRFTLWMKESTDQLIDQLWKGNNNASKSDFIEQAILFYSGYLTSEKNKNYLPSIVVSTLKGIVNESDNRQNRNLFKIAVELSVLTEMLKDLKGVSDLSFERIRGECIKRVRKLNGFLQIEDVIDWQNS